jgi:hypothetical protein
VEALGSSADVDIEEAVGFSEDKEMDRRDSSSATKERSAPRGERKRIIVVPDRHLEGMLVMASAFWSRTCTIGLNGWVLGCWTYRQE